MNVLTSLLQLTEFRSCDDIRLRRGGGNNFSLYILPCNQLRVANCITESSRGLNWVAISQLQLYFESNLHYYSFKIFPRF